MSGSRTPLTTAQLQQYYRMLDMEDMTKNWYLVESAVPITVVLMLYLGVTVGLGPRLMASRKPFDLRTAMRAYNLIQVIFNAFIFVKFFTTPGALTYMIEHSCRPDNSEKTRYLKGEFLLYSWHYFILKLFDLLDTVFLVLRKKNSHVTFLHVYHHTAMAFFTWYSIKYIKPQQGTVPALINLAVHSIMYTYFFLATFGPSVQRHLWWKSHLTKIQLGQFGLVIAYLWLLNYNDCDVSQPYNVTFIINVCIIAAFFINFYVQTYIKRSSLTQKKQS